MQSNEKTLKDLERDRIGPYLHYCVINLFSGENGLQQSKRETDKHIEELLEASRKHNFEVTVDRVE